MRCKHSPRPWSVLLNLSLKTKDLISEYLSLKKDFFLPLSMSLSELRIRNVIEYALWRGETESSSHFDQSQNLWCDVATCVYLFSPLSLIIVFISKYCPAAFSNHLSLYLNELLISVLFLAQLAQSARWGIVRGLTPASCVVCCLSCVVNNLHKHLLLWNQKA